MRHQQIKRITQKRSFLLFEVILSMALILLCFLPLLKPHALMRKIDVEYLEQIQLEAIAQAAFCHIKEQFYANQIPWEEIIDSSPRAVEIPFLLHVGKNKTKQIMCHYSTALLDQVNKTSQNKVGLVLELTLLFSSYPKPFIRTLYLEQH